MRGEQVIEDCVREPRVGEAVIYVLTGKSRTAWTRIMMGEGTLERDQRHEAVLDSLMKCSGPQRDK
jgi:hypothetical protein